MQTMRAMLLDAPQTHLPRSRHGYGKFNQVQVRDCSHLLVLCADTDYATLIDNIQVSWVKMGVEGSRRILQAGANDLGGTLMDENISRAAGATHGQEMNAEMLQDLVAPLDRPLNQRSTLYQTL